MDKFKKLLSFAAALLLIVSLLAGCGGNPSPAPTDPDPTGTVAPTDPPTDPGPGEFVDYASQLKLDMNSETAKESVIVKIFIDGDTTHFYVPTSVVPSGVLKARYLAVNTPESTGKIEEWGKKASNFTKEKLSQAVDIIIESDNETWNADSTGDRYLSWVWYKTADMDDYRNLNLELIQNGLARASNTTQNRYGEICGQALQQAIAHKLNVHSSEKDPDFYYGTAVELTLKELRANITEYEGMTVAFSGVVTKNSNNSVYVESYDAEDDMYYGMSVYYGYNLDGAGLDILSMGNEVRIVGSVQYYEAGGTWQVSDLTYRRMKPDDPHNIQKLSEGHEPAFRLTDPELFATGKLQVQLEDSVVEKRYAEMALGTTVSMEGLKVTSVYTTDNEESASQGAMTLTCLADGWNISVRTAVLRDAEGNLITESAYKGKTIDVKGYVDFYNGSYQIKVFSANDIVVH